MHCYVDPLLFFCYEPLSMNLSGFRGRLFMQRLIQKKLPDPSITYKAQVTFLGIGVKGESICGAGFLQSRSHFLETLSWKSVPT